MKALTSPESPRPRSVRRIPKPLMEKRRRERINHSLETLRLLMLDNTQDEKLKNPKVEKAEILESVVNFLKTEKEVKEKSPRPMKRALPVEQRPTSSCQRDYHDGMRSCLMRVSDFIASKSQESEKSDGDVAQASLALSEPQTHPSSSGHIHKAQAALPPQHLANHHRQHGIPHPYVSQRTGLHCGPRELLTSTAACTHNTGPVWRPWPQ